MSEKFILLIEGDKGQQSDNARMLGENGFRVVVVSAPSDALAHMQKQKPDAIIIDAGAGGGNVTDLIQTIKKTCDAPVLILNDNAASDVIAGFDAVCDDFIAGPYVFDELLLRLLRIIKTSAHVPHIIFKGTLGIKIFSNEVVVLGKSTRLTQNEFSLLLLFAQNENRILSNEYLYRQVWGQEMSGNNSAIKNTVYKLRKRLAYSGYTITSERRGGYCFEKIK